MQYPNCSCRPKTSTAIGVNKEIIFAKNEDVPIFGVYVDGADSNTLIPDGMVRSRTIVWDWEKIADWSDQCRKEGKINNSR